jgi:putative membrane protein
VKDWASRIWVVIAVAPNAMGDSGATLFYTFSMLSDRCPGVQSSCGSGRNAR